MEEKVRELVGIASSLAAGCSVCLEHHMAEARRVGATPVEIQEALDIARAVRLTALTRMDAAATRYLEEAGVLVMAGANRGCGPGCNC